MAKEIAADEVGLSEYESYRAKNIQRNNARLRALGLISAHEEKLSNEIAMRKQSAEVETKRRIDEGDESNPKKKKQKLRVGDPPTVGSRKSPRLQGIAAEGSSTAAGIGGLSRSEEREARIRECREVRLRRALEVSEAGAEKATKANPTASYEHCLMRIRSMTHNGLANRVKVIERAAGKHCIVKMAIFKSCLQDEGLWELADLASAALERLKALKPPEEDDH